MGVVYETDIGVGLWWLGASMLVAGSVIIGRREEGKDAGGAESDAAPKSKATGAEEGKGSRTAHGETAELKRRAKGRAS